jgi:hypothetical protein
MRIRCSGNPFTELLPSDSPGIVDVFTGSYLGTGVCLSAYCIATVVLVVRFEVSAQQRAYTPQYYILLESGFFVVNILLVEYSIIEKNRFARWREGKLLVEPLVPDMSKIRSQKKYRSWSSR